MNELAILVGIVLLLFGRRLFWLFVGAAGFIAGMLFSQELLGTQPNWLLLLIALAAGIVGALLSVFLQKLALALAGFLTGGYVLMSLSVALENQSFMWAAFLIGGIIGAVLILSLFDWALILLSSLAGAALVAQAVHVEAPLAMAIFVLALLLGVALQAHQFTRASALKEAQQAARKEK